jgi:hypothetical protein
VKASAVHASAADLPRDHARRSGHRISGAIAACSAAAWPLLDLTTVHQPIAELGARAVDRLLERIEEGRAAPSRETVLPVHLFRRAAA